MNHHLSRLHESAKRFIDDLFDIYPEWRGLALYEDREDAIMIEVPCPNPNVTRGLYVRVDEEITIGLDMFHMHFDREQISAALESLAGLFNENSVLLIYYDQDGKWIGSTFQDHEDPVRTPQFGERLNIRSWQGTHDKDIIGQPSH